MDQQLFEKYRGYTTEALKEALSQPGYLTSDARVAAIAALEERGDMWGGLEEVVVDPVGVTPKGRYDYLWYISFFVVAEILVLMVAPKIWIESTFTIACVALIRMFFWKKRTENRSATGATLANGDNRDTDALPEKSEGIKQLDATAAEVTATQTQNLNLREVGLAQRLLVWGFLASILGVFPIMLVAVVPLLLYCTWRISSALQFDVIAKVFCMLLMVVPLANAITLMVLSGKATRALQKAGIKVGLLGAKVSDLPAPLQPSANDCGAAQAPSVEAQPDVAVRVPDPQFSETSATASGATNKATPHLWGHWKIGLPIVLLAVAVIFYVVSSGYRSDQTSVAKQESEQGFPATLKAAEQGNVKAQLQLAQMYSDGNGVSKDAAQAAVWFRKSAEHGDIEAQFQIGASYRFGEGVPKDDAQAAVWFLKAAEQGDLRSQVNIGVMYYLGEGVSKDAAQAVAWYRKAAKQGYGAAQYDLGSMYFNGSGVQKDLVLAYAWYNLAAAQGVEQAGQMRDTIERKLPSSKRQEAQRLSSEWQPGQDIRRE